MNDPYLERMITVAIRESCLSPCAKSQRGVVIFHRKDGVVAQGHNQPPGSFSCANNEQCFRDCNKICVHAESAALHNLRRHLCPLSPGSLELIHVKTVHDELVESGPPSCWQCSREILFTGLISKIWLFRPMGWVSYEPVEFHQLTLQHNDLTGA